METMRERREEQTERRERESGLHDGSELVRKRESEEMTDEMYKKKKKKQGLK